ncbi:hypothetical protein Pta02_17980 [Planobispora takensis]|uniref:Uncharacterized protein n=1 Tax=Planobispora takensis TaxID=1367882 RepID=A0A8J3SWU3_9ACTN|nr:hypothetical protein Pta02_17980 [Planobispora takensis]
MPTLRPSEKYRVVTFSLNPTPWPGTNRLLSAVTGPRGSGRAYACAAGAGVDAVAAGATAVTAVTAAVTVTVTAAGAVHRLMNVLS